MDIFSILINDNTILNNMFEVVAFNKNIPSPIDPDDPGDVTDNYFILTNNILSAYDTKSLNLIDNILSCNNKTFVLENNILKIS